MTGLWLTMLWSHHGLTIVIQDLFGDFRFSKTLTSRVLAGIHCRSHHFSAFFLAFQSAALFFWIALPQEAAWSLFRTGRGEECILANLPAEAVILNFTYLMSFFRVRVSHAGLSFSKEKDKNSLARSHPKGTLRDWPAKAVPFISLQLGPIDCCSACPIEVLSGLHFVLKLYSSRSVRCCKLLWKEQHIFFVK